MKRIFGYVLFLIIILIAVSCPSSMEGNNIDVAVHVYDSRYSTASLIQPAVPVDIEYYQLVVSDSFGNESRYPSTGYSSISDSLEFSAVSGREYTLSVFGYHEEAGTFKLITKDSYSGYVFYGAADSSLTLGMKTLTTEGGRASLQLYVSEAMMPSDGSMPSVAATIMYGNSESESLELVLSESTLQTDDGVGVCLSTEFDIFNPGVCTLSITLSNPENNLSHTVTELMRIYPSTTSQGVLDFRYPDASSAEVVDGVYGVAWVIDEVDDTRLYRLLPEGISSASLSGVKAIDDPYDIVTSYISTEPVAYSPVLSDSGKSPFDNIEPWCDVKLVSMRNNGDIQGMIADNDIESFVTTSGDNDLMVHLVDMQYIVEDGNLQIEGEEHPAIFYYVSSKSFEGEIANTFVESKLHPGSGYYVGRYQVSCDQPDENSDAYIASVYVQNNNVFASNAAKLHSWSNQKVVGNFNIPAAHIWTHARSRSYESGFGAIDWLALSYIQLLYLVEYADWNSPLVLGISDAGNPQKTGTTDSMPYHTGVQLLENGKQVYQYRFIENLGLGNHELLDGIIINNSQNKIYTNTSTTGAGYGFFSGTFYWEIEYNNESRWTSSYNQVIGNIPEPDVLFNIDKFRNSPEWSIAGSEAFADIGRGIEGTYFIHDIASTQAGKFGSVYLGAQFNSEALPGLFSFIGETKYSIYPTSSSQTTRLIWKDYDPTKNDI